MRAGVFNSETYLIELAQVSQDLGVKPSNLGMKCLSSSYVGKVK